MALVAVASAAALARTVAVAVLGLCLLQRGLVDSSSAPAVELGPARKVLDSSQRQEDRVAGMEGTKGRTPQRGMGTRLLALLAPSGRALGASMEVPASTSWPSM